MVRRRRIIIRRRASSFSRPVAREERFDAVLRVGDDLIWIAVVVGWAWLAVMSRALAGEYALMSA
jgi:hypothetical protein